MNHTIRNALLIVTVAELGAELQSIQNAEGKEFLWQGTAPYVGLWHTTKSDAPFVCIEPWCSLPSKQDEIAELEKQEDLLFLAPGATYQNNWSITIE